MTNGQEIGSFGSFILFHLVFFKDYLTQKLNVNISLFTPFLSNNEVLWI